MAEGLAGLQDELERIDRRLRDEMLDAADREEADDAERRVALLDYLRDIEAIHAAASEADDRLFAAINEQAAADEAVNRAQAEPVSTVADLLRQACEGVTLAEAVQLDAQGKAVLAAKEVEQLGQLLPRIDALLADVDAALRDTGDWEMLSVALGREGVQALEIDAAGPEVAGLTNELLLACYGARFSLTLETLRAKQDGGQKEVFDIVVYDNGQPRPVDALSGGEKVIVSEALSLALAIFNARKNSVTWETLWRDETAGALDPDNAAAYVRMLRRARQLGGFHQVIFVAHQADVWESADAKLFIDRGRLVADSKHRGAVV